MIEQDKFKDIKAGDTVYIVESVRVNWTRKERFYVPAIVERTTKTQFIVEGGNRYKKDYGSRIGGEYFENSYYLGEKISHYNDDVIKDQTKERDEFVKKVNAVYEINDAASDIKVDIETKNLVLIREKINEVLELIKEEK